MKQSSRCRHFKAEADFRRNKDGFSSWCKSCHKQNDNRPEGRYRHAVRQARQRRLAWGLARDIYFSLVAQPCHYCGGPLEPSGIGLDRLDNDQGYVPGNVVLCGKVCNQARNNHWTEVEMRSIGGLFKLLLRYRQYRQQTVKWDSLRPDQRLGRLRRTSPEQIPDCCRSCS